MIVKKLKLKDGHKNILEKIKEKRLFSLLLDQEMKHKEH
jgi:hypothetical protein